MAKDKKSKYYEGKGGRKSSNARVRLYPNEKGEYIINGKDVGDYFQTVNQSQKAKKPLEVVGLEGTRVSVLVKGGGMNSQSEAVRHGLSRALEDHNEEHRKKLKSLGYLTRDARKKERKKPGKRGARRSPQWRKR